MRTFMGLLAALVIFFLNSTANADIRYTVTDLGKNAAAWDINNLGNVVGQGSFGAGAQAFLYNGTMNALEISGSHGSFAYGINDLGDVVGWYITSTGLNRGYVLTNGTIHTIEPLAGVGSFTQGISNNRRVVGYMNVNELDQHAFGLEDGKITDFGTLGGTYSGAWKISKNGQWIVGSSWTVNSTIANAFLLSNNGMQNLGTPGIQSDAYGVNNNGVVVGDANQLPFIFDGSMQILSTHQGQAYSINDNNEVVGTIEGYAFRYHHGVLENLDDLIDPLSGFHLITARGINNAGQIVGSAQDAFGNSHAFLLTPIHNSVPEPATATSLVLIAGMVLARRNRKH